MVVDDYATSTSLRYLSCISSCFWVHLAHQLVDGWYLWMCVPIWVLQNFIIYGQCSSTEVLLQLKCTGCLSPRPYKWYQSTLVGLNYFDCMKRTRWLIPHVCCMWHSVAIWQMFSIITENKSFILSLTFLQTTEPHYIEQIFPLSFQEYLYCLCNLFKCLFRKIYNVGFILAKYMIITSNDT